MSSAVRESFTLEKALDRLRAGSGAEATELFLVEPSSSRLWLAAHSGIAARAFRQRTSYASGEGFPGLVAEGGEALLSLDLGSDDRFLRTQVKAKGFRYFLCAPIAASGRVIGTLGVASRQDAGSVLDAERLVAEQAESLSEQLELEQLRAKELITGLPADPELDPKTNLERKLGTALSLTAQSTGASGGILLLRGSDSGQLYPVAWHEAYEAACVAVSSADPGQCACSLISQRQAKLASVGPGGGPKPCQGLPSKFATVACLPLICDSELLGIVSLGFDEQQEYPGRVMSTLGAMASRMALLAANAQAAVISEQRAVAVRDLQLIEELNEVVERSFYPTVIRAGESGGDATSAATEVPFLDLRCLGQLKLYRDSRPLNSDAFTRRRTLKLLKILLAHYGRSVDREVLVELLWPDGPPASAERQLRVLVHELRRVLWPDSVPRARYQCIARDGDGYAFNVDIPHRIDTREFVALVTEGERLHKRADSEAAVRVWQAAAGLYGGDFLEDERYSDWCSAERQYLRELFLSTLRQIADGLFERGDHDAAITCYRRTLRVDETLEEVHRELMYALWRSGQREDAMRQFRACKEVLETQVGTRPQAATLELHRRIVQSD